MTADFKINIITEPETSLSAEREADIITQVLASGVVDRVHLRKPDDEPRVHRLLSLIPTGLYKKLSISYFPTLARKYGCQYHLREGEIPPAGLPYSRSCHSPEEPGADPKASYSFLSPIYDSISKPGYRQAFPPASLAGKLPSNMIALGGVTCRSIPDLWRAGFAGAAMLGEFWKNVEDARNFAHITRAIERMKRFCAGFPLQFITCSPTMEGSIASARKALKGGCRWIQLRMKDAPESLVRKGAEILADDTRAKGAILLVDDHVEIAAQVPGVDGVHLGLSDMPRTEARSLLGEDKIIGSTANTPEQALTYAPLSNYLGVGPFRYTTTKKNLAPLLGAEGIQQVSRTLLSHGLCTPVVGIGGIGLSDVNALLSTGVQGLAISGAISSAPSPSEATSQFIKKIKEYTHE